MPRVRDYGNRKTKVEVVQSPRLRVQAPEGAFGLGGNQRVATDKSLETAGDVVARAARQQAEVDFQDIDGKLTAASLKIRLAFDDVPGNKARDQVPKSLEEFEREFNKLAAEFPNNTVAAAAQRSYQGQRAQLTEGLSFAAAKKFKDYDQKSTAAYVQLMDEEIVQSFSNTGAVGRGILKKLGALKAFAARNNISPEETTLLLKESASKSHRAVIERMLSNNMGEMANKYLQTVKSDMLGGDLKAVEGPAQEGSNQSEAYKAVEKTYNARKTVGKPYQIEEQEFHPSGPKMRVVTRQDYEPDPPKTLNEWIKRINKELEGKDENIIERAEARARRRWHDMEVEQAEAHKEDVNRVGDMIDGGVPWDEIPANAMGKLNFEERNALKQFHDKKHENPEYTTDWEAYRHLRLMAAGVDPLRIPGQEPRSAEEMRKEFMEKNLSLSRRALANAEYKELIQLQAGIKKGDTDILLSLEGYRSEQDIIEKTIGKKFDKSEAEEIRRAADMEIYYWKINNKQKDIPSPEVQKIIDGLIINKLEKVRYASPIWPDSWGGIDWLSKDKWRHQYKMRNKEHDQVRAIAREEQLSIIRELQKEKKEVSSGAILNKWRERMDKKINAR